VKLKLNEGPTVRMSASQFSHLISESINRILIECGMGGGPGWAAVVQSVKRLATGWTDQGIRV
jgi:hypothetical protein